MPEARYSEDQSRDDAGRFADEGKAAAKAAAPQKTAGGGLTNADTGATMKKQQLPSSTGANRFKKGFAQKNLDAHWDGDGKTQPHKNQYRGLTKDQYAARALQLVQSRADGTDILGYVTQNGAVVRYSVKQNDFVKGYPSGGIATMFKPRTGQKYFDRKKNQEGVPDMEDRSTDTSVLCPFCGRKRLRHLPGLRLGE